MGMMTVKRNAVKAELTVCACDGWCPAIPGAYSKQYGMGDTPHGVGQSVKEYMAAIAADPTRMG